MPKVFKLTQRTVESVACPPGKKDVLLFDGELRGFGLRVTVAGGKTFLAQYTTPGGKRRVALGAFGALTVEEARRNAKAVLGAAAEGRDLYAERKARGQAVRNAQAEAAYTFGLMVDAWAKARGGDRRPSYLREAVLCIRRNLPTWQARAASGITLADAVRAIDDIKEAKGTVAANRTLAYARAAYGWAAKRQHVVVNPLKGIERAGREVARERVLTADDLGAIWRACDTLSGTLAGYVRVLMLTLQRREEAAGLRWAELDNPADPTVWTLPAERAKNGRPHVVHLADPARAIIRALPRIEGNPYVFAGRQGKPIAAFGYAKNEIANKLAEMGESIADWRFHDFRRAGVTALADMGFPPHVCDRILNHITGSIQGIAAVYQRAEFLKERKAALDAWAAHVLCAADGRESDDKVVPLPRKGQSGEQSMSRS